MQYSNIWTYIDQLHLSNHILYAWSKIITKISKVGEAISYTVSIKQKLLVRHCKLHNVFTVWAKSVLLLYSYLKLKLNEGIKFTDHLYTYRLIRICILNHYMYSPLNCRIIISFTKFLFHSIYHSVILFLIISAL